jgi:hypothetical protein
MYRFKNGCENGWMGFGFGVWSFGPVYFLHRMDAVVPCTRPKTLSNG